MSPSQQDRRRRRRPAPQTWAVGDIAFLRSSTSFNRQDYHDLIDSGYLHVQTTCHPVIVLATSNAKAIVTPVSAFSTEANGLLPPWQQQYHRGKTPGHFRAFVGTQRPDAKHAALRLADPSMRMPKPKASWVYLPHFYCVPVSVLGHFNKAPTLLRVHPDSVAALNQHMRAFKKQYEDAGARLRAPAAVTVTAQVHKEVQVQKGAQVHKKEMD